MTELQKTPLAALHAELGAKFVPFAGYEMPVQFSAGVMAEHAQCRKSAGLFDVSHMGQISVRSRSGSVEDAARELERLVPVDVVGLAQGRQRYAFFTNPSGGLIDDLMVARQSDHLALVVNAACKQADFDHLVANLSDCIIDMHEDRALLALQGPQSEAVLGADAAAMRFMDVADIQIAGVRCTISRSGYTGLDGFEISLPANAAETVARHLLAHEAVAPIGLGARDSLRLEAGLCLYGQDLTPEISPVEAGLTWAIQKPRRLGGARAGGFPGAQRVLQEIDTGAKRRRVGLRPEGRAPVRSGATLYDVENGGAPVGTVTSGGFGPTIGSPISMGYVDSNLAQSDVPLFAELRGKRVPMAMTALPFIPASFKR